MSAYTRPTVEHGGSCIYVRTDDVHHLGFEDIEKIQLFNIECHCECSGVVSVKLKLIVLCVYRPPKSNFTTFLDTLCLILDECEEIFGIPCILL